MKGPQKKGAKGYGTSLPSGLRSELLTHEGSDPSVGNHSAGAPSRKARRAQMKQAKKLQRQQQHERKAKVLED